MAYRENPGLRERFPKPDEGSFSFAEGKYCRSQERFSIVKKENLATTPKISVKLFQMNLVFAAWTLAEKSISTTYRIAGKPRGKFWERHEDRRFDSRAYRHCCYRRESALSVLRLGDEGTTLGRPIVLHVTLESEFRSPETLIVNISASWERSHAFFPSEVRDGYFW